MDDDDDDGEASEDVLDLVHVFMNAGSSEKMI